MSHLFTSHIHTLLHSIASKGYWASLLGIIPLLRLGSVRGAQCFILIHVWTRLHALRWVPASAPALLVFFSTLSSADTLDLFLLGTRVWLCRGGFSLPTLPSCHPRSFGDSPMCSSLGARFSPNSSTRVVFDSLSSIPSTRFSLGLLCGRAIVIMLCPRCHSLIFMLDV
jgi:hypothetical protein